MRPGSPAHVTDCSVGWRTSRGFHHGTDVLVDPVRKNLHVRAVLLQWPAWLSGCGASNVVNVATAGPCGVAARGARAADAMAPHELMPPLSALVTMATEHDATTSTVGWWRTTGIHHNADTHTRAHAHRRACRARNWPPTATQPQMATIMAWYVTVNPVTSLGGTVTSRAWRHHVLTNALMKNNDFRHPPSRSSSMHDLHVHMHEVGHQIFLAC